MAKLIMKAEGMDESSLAIHGYQMKQALQDEDAPVRMGGAGRSRVISRR